MEVEGIFYSVVQQIGDSKRQSGHLVRKRERNKMRESSASSRKAGGKDKSAAFRILQDMLSKGRLTGKGEAYACFGNASRVQKAKRKENAVGSTRKLETSIAKVVDRVSSDILLLQYQIVWAKEM